MLSRALAGIRKETLIVNLPGSEKAVRESLEYCIESIIHGIEILIGSAIECARQEKNRMKKINVRNAKGYELCHDITQILPGEFKGAKFLSFPSIFINYFKD